MAESWYDGLADEAFLSEADRIYMKALQTVKAGIQNGLDFDKASVRVEIADEAFRRGVLDDVLKVIIAEEHFAKSLPLDLLAERLKLPMARIEKARAEMFEDVETSTVKTFYDNGEKGMEH